MFLRCWKTRSPRVFSTPVAPVVVARVSDGRMEDECDDDPFDDPFGDQCTFDMTFDGSPEAIARAPVNMEKLERVLEKVRSGQQNNEFSAEDTNILEQVILDAQKKITDKLVVPKARKRKTRRYDLFDEATAARVEANLATLKAAQDT